MRPGGGQLTRVAAVDCGTNSIRLLIADVNRDELVDVHRELRIVRLGQGVDGSGRLQTVTARSNPLYYALIAAFADLTGVPMVLNTSFNENEPVVCRPDEALDCFLRTKMDVLVLGDRYVSRTP